MHARVRGLRLARVFGCVAAVATASWEARALAAEPIAECVAAAESGQTLRDGHKLLDARKAFRSCAQVECPRQLQVDCAGWLGELEKSIPTVVLSAKGPSGDVGDVTRVTVDDRPLSTLLDGQALSIDPGRHRFRFERADGTSAEITTLVVEGVKYQTVVAHFDEAGGSRGTSAGSGGDATGTFPWRTAGWATTALGVVGLGVGIVFGAMAIADKSAAHCEQNLCDAEPLASARREATVATVAVVTGGILLGGGISLVVFAPHRSGSGVASGTSLNVAW